MGWIEFGKGNRESRKKGRPLGRPFFVEMLLGAPPSGDIGLTIAILTIASTVELSVSAVYTANPLGGDGISIDVQYIRPHRL
jgi:hypothetical protein